MTWWVQRCWNQRCGSAFWRITNCHRHLCNHWFRGWMIHVSNQMPAQVKWQAWCAILCISEFIYKDWASWWSWPQEIVDMTSIHSSLLIFTQRCIVLLSSECMSSSSRWFSGVRITSGAVSKEFCFFPSSLIEMKAVNRENLIATQTLHWNLNGERFCIWVQLS